MRGVFMKKIALVIDNSGSLTKEEMEKINVTKMLPISFIVNGEEYYEGENMSYEEFYKYLQDKKTDVSTSQPTSFFLLDLVKRAIPL